MKRRYGWSPDLKDHRDFPYRPRVTKIPASVDLRPGCPAVYDQGQLGSCTGNAIAGAIEYDLIREAHDMVPSRLFIYFNERDEEGTVQSDAGASIRDGIKAVAALGAPPESEWPYSDANPGPFQTKPPANVYVDALKYRVTAYESVPITVPARLACLGLKTSVVPLQQCLASGTPVVFGMTVYESFEDAAVAHSGIVPMPDKDESVLGGHAVLAVGYKDGALIVRKLMGCRLGSGWVLLFAVCLRAQVRQ